MRLRPTCPELFAKPLGCFSLAERNNNAAEFTAPQATTIISPKIEMIVYQFRLLLL
jgi:hypothetical protein